MDYGFVLAEDADDVEENYAWINFVKTWGCCFGGVLHLCKNIEEMLIF